MPYPTPSIGKELLQVPFPEMIQSMGLAVAEAQYELDKVGMRIAQMMSGRPYLIEIPDETKPGEFKTVEQPAIRVKFGKDKDGNDEELSLMELGFTPTFYQFVDTHIEVKISISMSYMSSSSRSYSHTTASMVGGVFLGIGGARMSVSSVNASYANKYQYSAEGSSLLRTKLVVVPTPAILEERIRNIIDS